MQVQINETANGKRRLSREDVSKMQEIVQNLQRTGDRVYTAIDEKRVPELFCTTAKLLLYVHCNVLCLYVYVFVNSVILKIATNSVSAPKCVIMDLSA